MKTSELEKYINKRVELTFKNDEKIYIGLIKEWGYIHSILNNDVRYCLIENYTNYMYSFTPSHVKKIKEMKNNGKI